MLKLSKITQVAKISLAAISLVFSTSCTHVPFDHPKNPSYAIQPGTDTRLGEEALQWRDEHGGDSGFIGLSDGVSALGARLKLMEAAENSIDAQYFIIKKDRAGALFAGNLLRAADRGVKVRLLIDDVFTPGADQPLTLLNSHPNIEVRLFNPVSRLSLKHWAFVLDFKRANRRMHNKSFTADNSMTIVGGRNIAEEYFELRQDVKFDDFEVFAIGPVVQQVSAGFDEFWNSELSVPMEAFGIQVDPSRLDEWREGIRGEIEGRGSDIYHKALGSSFLTDFEDGRITPVIASATLATDSPDKLLTGTSQEELAVVKNEIIGRIASAQHEILIITPYFIPGKRGMQIARELRERGLRVILVTNSLASTNHIPVHSAYARYRKRLLQLGVEVYEIRLSNENAGNEWGTNPELTTLHSKVMIIDRRTIFVGSFNFDPRSAVINTEMGLFIESKEAAERFIRTVFDELPTVAFRVETDSHGQLLWTYDDGTTKKVVDREPDTTWWRRTKAVIAGLLPESQL